MLGHFKVLSVNVVGQLKGLVGQFPETLKFTAFDLVQLGAYMMIHIVQLLSNLSALPISKISIIVWIRNPLYRTLMSASGALSNFLRNSGSASRASTTSRK